MWRRGVTSFARFVPRQRFLALSGGVVALSLSLNLIAFCSDREEQTPKESVRVMANQVQKPQDFGGEDELIYELMVKMHCEGCAKSVESTLRNLDQVSDVQVNLPKEIVQVKTALPGKVLVDTLVSAGREARLIGSSVDASQVGAFAVPESVGTVEENVSSVAEFRGQIYGHGDVVGVVRVIQKNNLVASVQVTLGGLVPGTEYSVVVHTFGDPRPGHQGDIFNGPGQKAAQELEKNVGFLCKGTADDAGQLEANIANKEIRVWEIIGRGLVVHQGAATGQPLASSILARSAVVGANHKKVCTCDGTVIWEAK